MPTPMPGTEGQNSGKVTRAHMQTDDDRLDGAWAPGEMAARVASFDWASTPLGPLDSWTPAMRTVVRALLASRFPMFLWAGPELLHIYNDAYAEVIGAKHPGAVGRPAAAVWAEIWDDVGPLAGQVMDRGETTWAEDLRLVMQRGGFAEETYFTFSYSPFHEDDGTVNGVFCAVTETTHRVVGERRLLAVEELAAALGEPTSVVEVARASVSALRRSGADLPVAALYLPADGQATLGASTDRSAFRPRLDPARLGPAGPPPGARRSWRPTTPTEILEYEDRPLACAELADPATQETLGWLVVGLNQQRPFDVGYRSFVDAVAARIADALITATAIETERRRFEALAELDRAKTAFFNNVSHEFRTPLTLLLGPLADALADVDHPLPDEQRERVEVAHRNGRRMVRLVDMLLDSARIDAGHLRPALEPTALGRLTADLASVFRSAFERSGVVLETQIEDAEVDVDAAMWETIVLNLLSNALKFTVAGSVTVRTERAGDTFRLIVRDTGVGIDPEEVDHVLDRFHRAVRRQGRSAEGSGIGLAVVKSLVELHDGTIAITSEVDEGTEVTVTLPGVRRNAAAAPPPRLALSTASSALLDEAASWVDLPPEGATGDGEHWPDRVLVVDDNADMRRYLVTLLGSQWEVRSARGGDEALTAVESWDPLVVVSDVMMPGLDGLELSRRLRSRPEHRRPLTLLVSARAGPGSTEDGMAAGADAYLGKPFTAVALRRRVEILVGRARDQRRAATAADWQALRAALGEAETLDEVVRVVHEHLVEVQRAAHTGLWLLDAGRRRMALVSAGGALPETTATFDDIPVDTPIPAGAATAGETVVVADLIACRRDFPSMVPALAAHGCQATGAAPVVRSDGVVIGALGVSWPAPLQDEQVTAAALESAAALVAGSVERVRSRDAERTVAEGLQDRLLRVDLRDCRAAVAVRYQPANRDLYVGGDWYDAFALDQGRVGLAVGDVVGHGVRAAATMAELRSAMAGVAMVDGRPESMLGILDRVARRRRDAAGTTVFYGVLEVEDRALSYVTAGHPPAVVAAPDGSVELLDDGRSWPLATRESDRPPWVGRTLLAGGRVLVLFTDGLVERRHESLDAGLDRLRLVLGDRAHLPTALLADEVVEALTGDGHDDDVALLALRLPGAGDRWFTDVVTSELESIPASRHRLAEWLRTLPLDDRARADVVLAIGEATTNAIEHGGGSLDRRLPVSIEACVDGPDLVATVQDRGGWQRLPESPHDEHRGRGLALMRAMVDDVALRAGRNGSCVVLRRRMTP